MKAMFIGLGSIGQRHLRNLVRLKGDALELIAFRAKRSVPVLDDKMNVVPGETAVERYGVKEFDDLGEALAQKPDVVFVTNPNSMHIDSAIAAARAGAHVFIEKPLGDSLDGVPELRAACEATGVQVFVGYQFRYHPGTKAAKAWLDKGLIGDVVKAHFENGEYLPGWHPYEDYRESYAARSDLGGGALLTQIHDFDLAYWLIGLPNRVYCAGGQLTPLEVDVEDAVTTVLSVPGPKGDIPVTIDQDYIRRPPVRRFAITGSLGVIEFDFHKRIAMCSVEGEEIERVEWAGDERNQMFVEELEMFLSIAEGASETGIGIDDGVASLRIALAARQSLKTGLVETP